MLQRYKMPLIFCFILTLLLTGTLGASAMGSQQKTPQANANISGGHLVNAPTAFGQAVNMRNVPKMVTTNQNTTGKLKELPPLRTGTTPTIYAQRKASAAHSLNAPMSQHSYTSPSAVQKQGVSPNTPTVTKSFQGQSDTCGCEPPDQALAASFSWVVQGVNTSIAVYDTNGNLQPGWPKTSQSFFNVPVPPNNCDPAGSAFMSDPRAFFDQNTNSIWVAMLEVEGPPIGDSCPFQSTYWVAVTRNGDATGTWNIYHFDMALGTTNFADYTQFGFDSQDIYFSGNMFNEAGTAFVGAEVAGANKLTMENDQPVTPSFIVNPQLNGVNVDTVQPTLGETLTVGGSLSGQFISSENINFGGGQCSTSACSGVVIWSMTNPGTPSASLSGVLVSTPAYTLAPNADEPGCTQCIETLDTRISGTPTWQRGVLTFALETGVNNGTQTVPGILWGQVAVTLNDSGTVTGGTLLQSGFFNFGGDETASFGALGTDSDGNVFMVYEFMSSTINPGVAYTSRRSTFTPGQFHDTSNTLRSGDAAYLGTRWGDYEAFSQQGDPFTDQIWFSGEYSTSTGDWSTFIGTDKLVRGQS